MTSALDPPDDDAPTEHELFERVVYALLGPAVRLARFSGLDLRAVAELVEMRAFHEVQREGKTLAEAGRELAISLRSVARLSRRLKTNFLQDEAAQTLPRRIEFALWTGPMSEARLGQVMVEETPETVRTALDHLLAEGRIVEQPGRTVVYAARRETRLVREAWLNRIDGLENLLATVADAVGSRFFGGPSASTSASPSLARNLTFRVRDQDAAELQKLYEEVLWPALRALDQAAHEDPESPARDVALSLVWAPYEWLRRAIRAREGEAK